MAYHQRAHVALFDDLAVAHAFDSRAFGQGATIRDECAWGIADLTAVDLTAADPDAFLMALAVILVEAHDDGGHAIDERNAELVRLCVGEVQKVCGVSVSSDLGVVDGGQRWMTRVCAEEAAMSVRADDDAVVPGELRTCAAVQDLHINGGVVASNLSVGALSDVGEGILAAWLALGVC